MYFTIHHYTRLVCLHSPTEIIAHIPFAMLSLYGLSLADFDDLAHTS